MIRNWNVSLSKTYFSIFLFVASLLTGCQTIVPIVKPVKYYSARASADAVDYIPKGTIYIGTIKVVPGDDAFLRTESRKQQAIHKMLDSAAQAGADYVVITDIQNNNKDYFFDVTYSDGYTIEGEMFRRISE